MLLDNWTKILLMYLFSRKKKPTLCIFI